ESRSARSFANSCVSEPQGLKVKRLHLRTKGRAPLRTRPFFYPASSRGKVFERRYQSGLPLESRKAKVLLPSARTFARRAGLPSTVVVAPSICTWSPLLMTIPYRLRNVAGAR